MLFGVLVLIFVLFFLTCLFVFIVSEFIDPENCFCGCSKLSGGNIQTGHTYLLPLEVCGCSWRGWQLGVQIQLIQLIALIYLNYLSISSFKPSFVDFWLVRIIFIGVVFIGTETSPWVCLKVFSAPYPNQTYIFASPAGLWKIVARVLVFVISHVVINTFIGFKEFPKVWQFLMNFWQLTYKHHRILFLLLGFEISAGSESTKAHSVNSWKNLVTYSRLIHTHHRRLFPLLVF